MGFLRRRVTKGGRFARRIASPLSGWSGRGDAGRARPPRGTCLAALLVLALAGAGCGGSSGATPPPPGGGPPPPPSPGTANVLTYHNDAARTGQNLDESVLTPGNVNSTGFGKVGFLTTTGHVDAEPLFVSNLSVGGTAHNVVFVATEHDLVYAFDADSFAQLWSASLLGANEAPSDDHGCDQITPEIGVTSTPVIDPKAGPDGTIFLVAMSKDSGGNYYQRLHALDLATGGERPGSPVTLQASYAAPAGGGTQAFAPGQYAERAGLLLLNGNIYLAFTSHCDQDPYQGWVLAYNENSLQQTAALDLTPNGSEGSVWMAGDGLAADANGNIYFLDANGTFDATLDAAGMPSLGDYGNAFVKLSTAGGGLAVSDYFTMYNTASESNGDLDLGSGGAMVLPDLQDASGATRHLAVGAGKDGNIYLVDRENMGKFNPNGDAAIYQEVTSNGLGGGVFAAPAYFNGSIYYGAVGDSLKQFALNAARLATPAASQSATSFGYPGATPSVSADSMDGGGRNGIVWAVENSGGNGVLHALDAANLGHELYNSNQAGARDEFADNKFITPMIADGRVYVGTPTGVIVFGLLP